MKSKTKKILCIGTATIDIIVPIPEENVEKISFTNASSSSLLLEMGRKLEVDSIDWYFGGGALNSAISMRRLGFQANCFIKIGQDRYGQEMFPYLKEQNIDSRHVITTAQHSTAVSVLISSHDHNPTILTHRGANAHITKKEFDWKIIREYDAIFITNLSKESVKIYPLLVQEAHKHGVAVMSNPGIEQLREHFIELFDCLSKLDVLIINRLEANELLPIFLEKQLITGKRKISENPSGIPPLKTGKLKVFIDEFLLALEKIGTKVVVITDGKRGAYIGHKGKMICQEAQKAEKVGTSVGAGDAFSSTICSLWFEGMELEQAALYASHNSSAVVSSIDAQMGLLTRKQLEKAVPAKK